MKHILILIFEKMFSKLKLTVLTSCQLCVLYMLGTAKKPVLELRLEYLMMMIITTATTILLLLLLHYYCYYYHYL